MELFIPYQSGSLKVGEDGDEPSRSSNIYRYESLFKLTKL
jgi:hypothetical protein